jgi:hypothetical protein
MRTWKCPMCGHTEEIGYDWLAEHGGPVCQECDRDMELRPSAEADHVTASEQPRLPVSHRDLRLAGDREVLVERLVDKADAAGLKPEDFDETIHEFAASTAADVNNGGLDGQIQCLVDGLKAQHAERQIDQLIDDRTNRNEEEE